jgi:hypothetical protein
LAFLIGLASRVDIWMRGVVGVVPHNVTTSKTTFVQDDQLPTSNR